MSGDLRRDPTTGSWVIVAPARLQRPAGAIAAGLPVVRPEDCPFCPGHEADTGPTLAAIRDGDAWIVRAVANRFPALMVETGSSARAEGPYDQVAGTGAHEVIVEGRDHALPSWQQSKASQLAVLQLVRERLRDLSGDGRLRSLSWFRNHGQRSGSSQPHAHSQIIGLPLIPPLQAAMLDRAASWLGRTGRPLYADIVRHEQSEESRLLIDGEIVAICPFASSSPFEVWLLPSAMGTDDFRDVGDATLSALSGVLSRVLTALAAELPDLSYNLALYSKPPHDPAPGFRWHVRITPRLELPGGLDVATGVAINGVAPEQAAARLRARL